MSRSDRGDRERWHGEAVTDEGTGFGLRLLCAEGILPPGTAQDEHFVLIFAFPRTPFTGVTPWAGQKTSGAQNLSGLCDSFRATGPWLCEKLGPVRFHRCAWLCRSGGDWCWAVGRDDLGAPLRVVSQIHRRGGTLGRPVSMEQREAQGPPLSKPGVFLRDL